MLFKEYKAKPITIEGWELLSKHLKGCLLDDLSYQKDFNARIVNQSTIQMRDYDELDVVRHLGRTDIRHKFLETVFEDDVRVTEKIIKEIETDPKYIEFQRELLSESGIIFQKETKPENPPQDQANAE